MEESYDIMFGRGLPEDMVGMAEFEFTEEYLTKAGFQCQLLQGVTPAELRLAPVLVRKAPPKTRIRPRKVCGVCVCVCVRVCVCTCVYVYA